MLELLTRTPLEGAGNLGFIPMYKLLRRVLLAYLYKGYKDSTKAELQYELDQDSDKQEPGFGADKEEKGFGESSESDGFGDSEEEEGF